MEGLRLKGFRSNASKKINLRWYGQIVKHHRPMEKHTQTEKTTKSDNQREREGENVKRDLIDLNFAVAVGVGGVQQPTGYLIGKQWR